MSEMELLLWARGPGFALAVGLLCFGIVLRLFEIFSLGRRADRSTPRRGVSFGGLRTVVSRSFRPGAIWRRAPITYLFGYLFHLGLFVALFFFIPHIEFFRPLLGFGWPGLPTAVVDAVTLITLAALIVLLVDRLLSPVKRLLSTFGDYAAWALTFAPILTGYLAYHHLFASYTRLLALHILSAELLLVALPFTRLAHSFTLFIARWYTGEAFARKGVAA